MGGTVEKRIIDQLVADFDTVTVDVRKTSVRNLIQEDVPIEKYRNKVSSVGI